MRKVNMTTMSNSWLGASALCALLAVAGCSSNGSSNGGPSQPAQPNAYNTPGPTERHSSAPVYLNLRGPEQAMGGNITLDVEIVVNEPITVPVTLQVQLPPGVTLVSGLPNEVLTLPQPGKLYRQYVVYSPGPLTQPVFVTADATGPNNAWGFSAKRQYPAAVNNPAPYPRKPPTGRPGAIPVR